MGTAVNPQKAKLFIGVIFQESKSPLDNLKNTLRAKFGDIDFESCALDFNYTDHYKISGIKTLTNKIERRLSGPSGARSLNLDPGYLNDAKVVLATTKDYSHRIYLKQGIYAEITLAFTKGAFRPYYWSYPDYQTKEYLEIFTQMREIFMAQRR
jgi:hypothetical protein